jgi:hypothetical protein
LLRSNGFAAAIDGYICLAEQLADMCNMARTELFESLRFTLSGFERAIMLKWYIDILLTKNVTKLRRIMGIRTSRKRRWRRTRRKIMERSKRRNTPKI